MEPDCCIYSCNICPINSLMNDCLQVFSFKLRGAYNKVANLPVAARERGILCSSAGNHAQGVALAAKRLVTAFHTCTGLCLW